MMHVPFALRSRSTSFSFGAVVLLLSLATSISAQTPDPALEKKVRGVLEMHCYKCHSHQAGKSKGELMVDSLALMVKGGESGPAVVPGHPEKSLLIRAIEYSDDNLQMPPPPNGKKLPAEDIALLTAWVKAGAPWTEAPIKAGLRRPGKITAEDRRYWAFQPIKAGELPGGNEANPIDRFILARLEKEGLKPSPSADPRTLIRRLTFDVIGLPPTPEEVDAFVQEWNTAETAQTTHAVLAKLVDRLLASPHYGERWGRHWLDVVRFAESDGYRLDSFRPHAYRYRDYVIKSFNDDKPYDQFVREQIAGDELYPDSPDALVAIGYLTHGIYEFNQRNVRGQWHEMVSEVVDVTGEAFMGLSVGCARCHDHKFDAILQKDYYALRSFFEGILPSEELPYATSGQRATFEKKLASWQQKTAKIHAQIEAIEGPVRAKDAASATSKFPPDIQGMLKKPAAQRNPFEQQLATLAYRQLLFEYEKLDTKIKGAEKDRLLALRKELAKFDADRPAPCRLHAAIEPNRRRARVLDGAERGGPLDHATGASGIFRPPGGPGAMAHAPGTSAHKPGHRQSHLAAALRPRPRCDRKRFRQPRRKTEPSRAVRLAHPSIRTRWMEHEEAAPADSDLEDVSTGVSRCR